MKSIRTVRSTRPSAWKIVKDEPAGIRHDCTPVPHDGKPVHFLELAGSFSLSPELTDELPGRTGNDDAFDLVVQDVEVARAVKPDFADISKLFPGFARQRTEPVELLEPEFQHAILAGEFDDLLGGRRQCGEQTGHPGPADASTRS